MNLFLCDGGGGVMRIAVCGVVGGGMGLAGRLEMVQSASCAGNSEGALAKLLVRIAGS